MIYIAFICAIENLLRCQVPSIATLRGLVAMTRCNQLLRDVGDVGCCSGMFRGGITAMVQMNIPTRFMEHRWGTRVSLQMTFQRATRRRSMWRRECWIDARADIPGNGIRVIHSDEAVPKTWWLLLFVIELLSTVSNHYQWGPTMDDNGWQWKNVVNSDWQWLIMVDNG